MKTYYENSARKTITNYKDNELDGEFIIYDIKGNVFFQRKLNSLEDDLNLKKEVFSYELDDWEEVPLTKNTTGYKYRVGELDEEGKKQGEWITFDEDTLEAVQFENYKDGKLNGTSFYIDNIETFTIYKETFKDNVSDGEFLYMRTDSGEIEEEGKYVNGEKLEKIKSIYNEGIKKWEQVPLDYDTTGVRYKEVFLDKQNRKQEEWIFYEDGEKHIIENYKDGKLHGEWKSYHPDGKTIAGEGHYKDNNLHGEFTKFYRDGTIKSKEYYHEGKEITKEEWQKLEKKEKQQHKIPKKTKSKDNGNER